MAEARNELQKLTECSICFQPFTDPRMLACFHTFCLDCLEKTAEAEKKEPEGSVPCPLCRKHFVIPAEGMRGLQKNFFMENLMNVEIMFQHGDSLVIVCDMCKALHDEDRENIKEATMRCLDCIESFCNMCSKAHKLNKLCKTHNIVKIGSKTDDDIRKMAPTRNCPVHSQQPLNFYCADCKKIICVSCFVENHASHKCKDVTTLDKEFRQTIEMTAFKISKCAEGMLLKGKETDDRSAEVLLSVTQTEDRIVQRSLELKEMIDSQTKSLLDELSLIKQKQVKDIANDKEEIERSHTILKSFEMYCTELKSKGSASDVCGCVDELVNRANDLEKDHKEFLSRPIEKTEVSFQASNTDELLKTCSGNIVGQIHEKRTRQELRNFDSTSYYSAVTQCLCETFLLMDELRSTGKEPITDAFLGFWKRRYSPEQEKAFSKFFEQFIRSSPNLCQQLDGHDLFVHLLNVLKSEERHHTAKVSQSCLEPKEILTAVDRVFGGHVLIKYACLICNQPTFVCESLLDISLPIREQQGNNNEGGMKGARHSSRQGDRALKLTECLETYTTPQYVPKSYMGSFCLCKSEDFVHVMKQPQIHSPPAVLVLHLDRFEKSVNGFTKRSDSVTYEEYLDLGPYCSQDCLRTDPWNRNVWYSLFGVVVHNGSAKCGNSTAYVKMRDSNADATKKAFLQKTYPNCRQVSYEQMLKWRNGNICGYTSGESSCKSKPKFGGHWIFMRDNCARSATPDEALSQQAFMLFYERVF